MDDLKSREYEKLMNDIIVSDNNTKEENECNIGDLSQKIIDFVPEKLYRFRSCEEYNFVNLRNDEISGSLAMKQNDPMECVPYYDLNQLTAMIQNELSDERFEAIAEMLNNGNIPSEYEEYLPNDFKDKS